MTTHQGTSMSEEAPSELADENTQRYAANHIRSMYQGHEQQQILQQQLPNVPQQNLQQQTPHTTQQQEQLPSAICQQGANVKQNQQNQQIPAPHVPWSSYNVNSLPLQNYYPTPGMLQSPYSNPGQVLMPSYPALINSSINPVHCMNQCCLPYSFNSNEDNGNKIQKGLILKPQIVLTSAMSPGANTAELVFQTGNKILLNLSGITSSVNAGVQTEELCSSTSKAENMTKPNVIDTTVATPETEVSHDSGLDNTCISLTKMSPQVVLRKSYDKMNNTNWGKKKDSSETPKKRSCKKSTRKFSSDPESMDATSARKSKRLGNPDYKVKNKNWKKDRKMSS